uniref:Uncharacterized protein n=1 Tax=Picea glauca TaxID=3330 RepID=A0A101LZC5_PICGL|nr:hypothetical protein ABT39_MTgene5162 [Picea glauca]
MSADFPKGAKTGIRRGNTTFGSHNLSFIYRLGIYSANAIQRMLRHRVCLPIISLIEALDAKQGQGAIFIGKCNLSRFSAC